MYLPRLFLVPNHEQQTRREAAVSCCVGGKIGNMLLIAFWPGPVPTDQMATSVEALIFSLSRL